MPVFLTADAGLVIEPGGYLQWQELNLGSTVIATAKAGLNQSATEELIKEAYSLGMGR